MLSSVGSPGGSGIINAMHLPREPTPLAHDAPNAAHATLFGRRVRAAMAVKADKVVAANAVVTSRLARD